MSRTPVRRCQECGSDKLIRDYENAEIVCANCGFVVQEKIADTGPEWRAFNDEQKAKRTRVGAPLTYTIHDKGLSTVIDWRRLPNTRHISPDQAAQIYNLRKWQRRVRLSDASERNLAFALAELSKMSTSLNIPRHILETASVIYRRALKLHLIRGRSIQGMVAAAIYMACRQCGVARTLDEISRVSLLSKKEIGRSYRFMVKELGEFVPPITPLHYVSRFSNQLGIQGKTERLAAHIIKIATEMGLTSGRGPTGIAAAALYVASILNGGRLTQRELAEVANVTEVTVRNRYASLLKHLDLVVTV
ncbi:transcription initiation factor IIB [Candidatus Bathyarchaeota archaeon]|nr:transcription initiation factor IIB [Candidatus Bathyarchaeota archaeon]